MPLYTLSKSTTMLGRQCTKALWLNKHQSRQRYGAYTICSIDVHN